MKELSICVKLESALIHLQGSVIELESSLIQLQSSLIRQTRLQYEKNVGIRELSNLITELSTWNTVEELFIWIQLKSGLIELDNSLIELESSAMQLESSPIEFLSIWHWNRELINCRAL